MVYLRFEDTGISGKKLGLGDESKMIEFKEINLRAKAPDLTDGGRWKEVPLVQRIDPLTQKSTRLLTGVKLQPESPPDLSELASLGGFCPFCDGTFEKVTYPFEPEVVAAGRLRRNRAAIVPNIMAYSGYSSVGIYDTSRHFLGLEDFTAELIFDAMCLMVEHGQMVRKSRPDLVWSSISANYLPSSGSSVLHPHLQSSHDLEPMQIQREMFNGSEIYYRNNSSSYFDDLLQKEATGPRFVGRTGSVGWITPFAPRGFQEIWGICDNKCDVTELDEVVLADLSDGLNRVLAYYKAANFSAFNYSMVGGGPKGRELGFRVALRILVRSNPDRYYRSDVTYFERLLDEPLIDVAPEEVAALARSYFI